MDRQRASSIPANPLWSERIRRDHQLMQGNLRELPRVPSDAEGWSAERSQLQEAVMDRPRRERPKSRSGAPRSRRDGSYTMNHNDSFVSSARTICSQAFHHPPFAMDFLRQGVKVPETAPVEEKESAN